MVLFCGPPLVKAAKGNAIIVVEDRKFLKFKRAELFFCCCCAIQKNIYKQRGPMSEIGLLCIEMCINKQAVPSTSSITTSLIYMPVAWLLAD